MGVKVIGVCSLVSWWKNGVEPNLQNWMLPLWHPRAMSCHQLNIYIYWLFVGEVGPSSVISYWRVIKIKPWTNPHLLMLSQGWEKSQASGMERREDRATGPVRKRPRDFLQQQRFPLGVNQSRFELSRQNAKVLFIMLMGLGRENWGP